MPGIVNWPTGIERAVEQSGDIFENECQRRHFAEYVCGLIIAHRKTVAGINREFAVRRDDRPVVPEPLPDRGALGRGSPE